MPRRDEVALVHAPSVYDFRQMTFKHYGPISDVIPSKPIFDMYPAGFFYIASYLEKRGVKTGIYNIAARMVNEPNLYVPRLLKRIKAEVYGIDIHWLVHAHGGVEVARMLKEMHAAPIIVGGLSATYYWREILERYPFIDAIVLGDTTEPVFFELVEALERGDRRKLHGIPNIAFRDDGKIRYTGIRYVPIELDDLKPDYSVVLKVLVRSGIRNSLPWSTFLKHPITAVITYKGCPYNCLGCGGSNFTYRVLFHRKSLGVKSPKVLFEEYKEITERLKAPIFFVNDLQVLGRKFVEEFTQLLSGEKADVELFFEFFTPPSRDLLELYRRTGDRVHLQLSPESHDERVRRNYGRPYGNDALKSFVKNARDLEFTRLDLYFMVGLPLQTVDNVKGLGDFYLNLYEAGKGIVDAFVAPLAPFVDPGSPAFHSPRKYGYNILAHTLEEHRKLLLANEWYNMLNYETDWMNRREIAEATYSAVESLTRAKFLAGTIDKEYYESVIESIENARKGRPKYGLDSKETLKEEELYPVRRFSLSYLTLRSLTEIIMCKIGM
ncbi:TIGR04190 family B12-binding domain/radical SAM domain protein [Infirmifilum lucidum]|uniref:TIGR04190 family B12-binding domain/radical SAM domain protein n=1 Tax=Infirmifilum lucidum TaxID=2776706 RepID=A0A7L9FFS3_9CREN|nr:TIGR04190 family B12-binding domain/radical SAM domain protein [Infirmifilum lucidum]QOJ78537.1 TIGR04190 family B12-binding domain/radical SAM domain protein [Infirmifilum lucidum]